MPSTRRTTFPPRWSRQVMLVALTSACPAVAAANSPGSAGQQDWSGGFRPDVSSTAAWGTTFHDAQAISWLAVPGQLSLACERRPQPVHHLVTDDFIRPAGLTAADLDDDGDLDLIGAAIGGSSITWWENAQGDGIVWRAHPVASSFDGAISVRAGDLDGDGDLDLVGGAWRGGEIAWWRNDGLGATWIGYTIAAGADGVHWVDIADLDDDGDRDVVAAVAGLDRVSWWSNSGGDPISWQEHAIGGAFAGARSALPGDLDGDGRLDIVGAALDGHQVAWWRNLAGDPVGWLQHIVSPTFWMAHHVVPRDVDGDGDLDLVGAGYQSTRVALWRNHGGDPILWERQSAGSIAGALVVDARDLDGDGRIDLVATSDLEDRVSWWQNDGGDPVDWPEHQVTEQLPGAWPLEVADVDGNGSLDVIAGASESSQVAWWSVGRFLLSGTLTGTPLAVDTDIVSLDCELDAVLPPETSARVEVRTAASVDGLAAWHEIDCGRPLPVLRRAPVVLQYRLTLATDDPEVSPLVRAIQFYWSSSLSPEPPRRARRRYRP